MEKKRKRKWFYIILYGICTLVGLLALFGWVGTLLQKHKVLQGEYYRYGSSSIGVNRIGWNEGSAKTECVNGFANPQIDILVNCSPDASGNCSFRIHAAVVHENGGRWGSTWEDGTGGPWNPIYVQLEPGEQQIYPIGDSCFCCWQTSSPPKKLVLAIRDQNGSEADAGTTFQLSP